MPRIFYSQTWQNVDAAGAKSVLDKCCIQKWQGTESDKLRAALQRVEATAQSLAAPSRSARARARTWSEKG